MYETYKNWLRKQTTIDEAEAAHMLQDERLGPDPVPFGFVNKLWRELLAQMQEGDELWEFCSSAKSWQQLMGQAGIALVRDGEVVTAILTKMN